MRIMVIGGTGFIGPYVIRRLCSLGHEVIAAHTGAHETDLPAEVAHLHSPLLKRVGRPDLGPLRAEFARLKPDVVVDMWPQTEHDATVVGRAFRGVAH
ncbi:MAG: NAD-dependent epimerase/dehydratase family protein, partial [Candidatus Dormibacteraceae bacterium]